MLNPLTHTPTVLQLSNSMDSADNILSAQDEVFARVQRAILTQSGDPALLAATEQEVLAFRRSLEQVRKLTYFIHLKGFTEYP